VRRRRRAFVGWFRRERKRETDQVCALLCFCFFVADSSTLDFMLGLLRTGALLLWVERGRRCREGRKGAESNAFSLLSPALSFS